MTVAILSALQSELDLLVDSMERPQSGSIADWPTHVGHIADTEVVLARAGLGKVNTAALAALVWQRHRPSLLVFTGVAGGLDPGLGVGDIVVAKRTIQYDTGVLTEEGLRRYQAGHIPFFNPTDEFGFTPSPQTLKTARGIISEMEPNQVLGHNPRVVLGTILTGDIFLQDDETRANLFTELSAQAIDMESGALAQIATRLGVDHLVIRSLSDLAGANAHLDFERFLPEASANSARLVLALLGRIESHDGDHPIGA